MNHRLLPLLLSLAAAPALAQAVPGLASYCLSDPSGPTVYFSESFDTRLNPNVTNDAYPIQREFYAYIRARYGFSTNSNYPITCPFSASTGISDDNRGLFEGRMRGENRKVVEVDWKYLPDEAAVTASFHRTGDPRNPPPPLPAEQGFCATTAFEGPLYISEVFDPARPLNISLWSQGFFRLLSSKYGYKGYLTCENATGEQARRIVKAWSDGVRAAGRKVVETGWKYEAAATTAPAAPVDEDREPARPAPASAAETDARKLAGKEAPAALAYCQKDRLLSVVFNCLRVQQAVIAYRVAHASGTPEPLAGLFTGDKLDCTHCLDNQTQRAWARRQALAQKLKPPVANCVAREFVSRLKAKPFPNRVQEHYDASVAACKG